MFTYVLAGVVWFAGTIIPTPTPNNDSPAPRESPSSVYSGSSTTGERNAVEQARNYLEVMAFSYDGLVDQLEFEGYTHSEAVYGVDHCGADWYEQAAIKAADYLDLMSFSRDQLIDSKRKRKPRSI